MAEVGLDGAGIDAVTVVPMLFAVITDAARTHSLIIPCSEGISAKSDRLLPESRDSLLIACSEATMSVEFPKQLEGNALWMHCAGGVERDSSLPTGRGSTFWFKKFLERDRESFCFQSQNKLLKRVEASSVVTHRMLN